MNEITRVHLASTPYNIELRAKKELEIYLHAVKSSMGADEDTLREIEARMVELLEERGVKGDKVITSLDVAALKTRLGDPKEFADVDKTEIANPTKRFMRDPQHALLGGVCAGLSAYFGWDAVWVRVAAIVLAIITSGVVIPIYLVLWLVLPPARTAAERLQMSGKPVTLESIAAESAEATGNVGEPLLVKVLRLFLGITFVFGAFLAAAAVAAVIGMIWYHSADFFVKDNMSWLPFALGLMSIGGIALAILLGVIAFMLITRSYSRRLTVSAIVTVILGLSIFGSGAAIAAVNANRYHDALLTYNQSQVLILPDLTGIQEITAHTGNVKVEYHVASGAPTASLRYNSKFTNAPAVKLVRNGSALQVTASDARSTCHGTGLFGCPQLGTTIVLYGPALQKLTAQKTDDVEYLTETQGDFAITAENAHVTVSSVTQLGTLSATLSTNASLDTGDTATDKTILSMGGGSNATLGYVGILDIQNLECTNGMQNNVFAYHAQQILRAGQQWNDATDQTDCLSVNAFAPSRYRPMLPMRPLR